MTSSTRQPFIAAIVVLLALTAAPSLAADWPQFLGPTRNGVYPGNGDDLAASWPADGPRVLWRMKVGQGYAGPAVAKGRVILFHRVSDNDVVDCLDAQSGKVLWSFKYETEYRDEFGFDEGPRAVPAISDGRVYTFGAQGMLHCLNFDTGEKLWSVDTRSEYRSDKGFFGNAASPLVEGDLVMLNIGGRGGKGIVALDRKTGKLAWAATDDEAGYASPVAATIGDRRYAFFFNRAGLVALNPTDGTTMFRIPFRARMNASVNAASPLVIDDLVFVSTSYGVGGMLLRVKGDSTTRIWANDEAMSNHYATCVPYKGRLFGFHGRQESGPELRCVALTAGTVDWKEPMEAGTLLLAGDRLLILTEQGRLILAPASPDGFKPISEAKILRPRVRAYPALADGLLLARDESELICVDLRRAKP